MLNFKKLEISNVVQLKNYYKNCEFLPSNYSAVFAVMWASHLNCEYDLFNNCLIYKLKYAGKTYFYYPVSLCGDANEEEQALDEIENFCKQNYIKLNFSAVPQEKIGVMIKRYGTDVELCNSRKWRDYLYNASDFITYSGKKFSGQRNHVNKFKKLYPNFEFCSLSKADSQDIYAFLKEYEYRQLIKNSVMAEEEMAGVFDLIPHLEDLNLYVGAIKINGKICSLSIAEKCKNQLIIHVEKALSEYAGIYPTTAHEFAKAFAQDVKYLNREDDSGDIGLRKSKLQYNPCALVDKYDVTPKRAIDKMKEIPAISCQRVEIKKISNNFADEFYRLEYDLKRNEFWGYNWRDNVKGEPTKEYFLQSIAKDFENKNEVPMGIFYKGKLIGEVVLHNFGYKEDCEVGARLLPEYEGQGFAREAILATIKYAFIDLNLQTVYAKCYKQNERSKNMLLGAGMIYIGEDETYFHFKKTAKD